MKTASGRAFEVELRWASRFASTKDVPWHSHQETELVAVTQGRCRIRIGERSWEGARGSIFVLPAGEAQFQETLVFTRTTYVGFAMPPGLFDERARQLKFDPGDPALLWMEQLCDGRRARPPLSAETSRTLLLALLRRITDMDTATGSEARFHPAVRAARAHLEANPAQPHTLRELARSAGVSVSHLTALFAEECGVGAMRYLQQLRMERACWLLASPYARVREVAASCGYEDVNYFTRLFHRRFGVSPGRWRKKRPAAEQSQRRS